MQDQNNTGYCSIKKCIAFLFCFVVSCVHAYRWTAGHYLPVSEKYGENIMLNMCSIHNFVYFLKDKKSESLAFTNTGKLCFKATN